MNYKKPSQSKKNLTSLLFYTLLMILFWLNFSFYALAQDSKQANKTIYTPQMMNLKKAPPMKENALKKPLYQKIQKKK